MKKVLIIEDDRWFADSVAKPLHEHGWQTFHAASGREGINAIDNFHPDVLLVDVLLPDVAAPALLNELQSHPDLASLPIVLCTSLDGAHFEASSLKSYGVKKVLDKAKATPHQIVEALEHAIA